MNYLEALHSFGNEIKNKLRKLENVQSKIINHVWSRTFNSVCINENILPNYVKNDNLSYFILTITNFCQTLT